MILLLVIVGIGALPERPKPDGDRDDQEDPTLPDASGRPFGRPVVPIISEHGSGSNIDEVKPLTHSSEEGSRESSEEGSGPKLPPRTPDRSGLSRPGTKPERDSGESGEERSGHPGVFSGSFPRPGASSPEVDSSEEEGSAGGRSAENLETGKKQNVYLHYLSE